MRIVMKHPRTYAAPPIRGRPRNAGSALFGRSGDECGQRRPAGAIVTSATREPPSQPTEHDLAMRGVGESHVKVETWPERTSAPSTESPMTSAVIGSNQPEDAVGGPPFANRVDRRAGPTAP